MSVLEQLAIQVRNAALAGRGVAVLARVGLQQRDEFLEILGRHLGVHGQHVRHVHQVGDRREVLDRIVRILGVGGGVGRHRAHSGDAERVAVRRGLGQRVGADRAAATATVLHHHGLAQLAAQRVGHGAADDVGGAARRERYDQADRLVGIRLRVGDARLCQAQHGQGDGRARFQNCFQEMPPILSWFRNTELRSVMCVDRHSTLKGFCREIGENPVGGREGAAQCR